jgi:hypothetical protein
MSGQIAGVERLRRSDGPLVGQGDLVNEEDDGRDEDASRPTIPVGSGAPSVPRFGCTKRGTPARQSTYQSAVPRKHMVEPLYIGSVWTLKGKPVTEKRKSSVSAAGADIEVD